MESFLSPLTGLGFEAPRIAYLGAAVLFVLATALVVGLGWRSRLMMSRARRNLLLALRIAVLALLVGALAQIVATRYERTLSVAFLIDTSQSIPDGDLQRTQGLLERAWSIKDKTGMRALNFDRVGAEASKPDAAPAIRRLSSRPGTDIARAIHAGQDLFESGTFKRAVLISDGNETTGDALFEAGNAKARGIHIDVIPLSTQTDRDIYIESINLPRRARPGERINVSVTVMSNFATQATLTLRRGKVVDLKKQVDVVPGANTFDFTTTVKNNHAVQYNAEVDAQGDGHPENNRLTALLRVIGNPRIMIFSGSEGKDLPLIEALSASRLSVKAAPVSAFPSSLNRLTPFDLVVLSNVDVLNFGEKPVALLKKFVGEYGGGLVMVGGENASKLRSEKDAERKKRKKLPIEDLLPVILKEKKKTEPNPVALILLIDKSSSMARENKFGMAIRAAKDSISLLGERSKIGVILFDDFPRWAIPMQVAKDKEKIIQELDRFGVDGGTSIYPAVKEAYATLKPMTNKVKHVILLSDGYSLTTFNQNAHVIQYMADKKITVSTVALGKESDKKHLRKIAQLGRGRFYYTEDITQIPKIFMEETKSITKTNVVETEFVPELIKRGEMLRGMDLTDMPALYGYNAAKTKPTSEAYMTAEKKEPLLASWRYGLGKVTFFGSDGGSGWAHKWPAWKEYAAFWSQVARNTLGDQNRRSYRLETTIRDDRAEVTVDALDQNGNFLNDLDLALEVAPPEGEPVQVPLSQWRPGGYRGQFPIFAFGEYSFQVRARDAAAARGEGIGRVFLSPPTEFISQAPNTALLKKIANLTDGRYNPTLEQIFEVPEQTFPHSVPLWPYLLYGALGLFLLSVLIRRS